MKFSPHPMSGSTRQYLRRSCWGSDPGLIKEVGDLAADENELGLRI